MPVRPVREPPQIPIGTYQHSGSGPSGPEAKATTCTSIPAPRSAMTSRWRNVSDGAGQAPVR